MNEHELVIPAGQKRQVVLIHDTPETVSRIIRLAGEGAEVIVDEIFLIGNVQSHLTIVHDASRTISRVNTRGVVGKDQVALAHAKVVISEHSQLSDSFVSQHFLLLDDSSHVDAVPSLEIEADDVKASHAATLSSFDPEMLFYMTSRGLSDDEAKKLIIQGFLKLPQGYEQLVEQCQI